MARPAATPARKSIGLGFIPEEARHGFLIDIPKGTAGGDMICISEHQVALNDEQSANLLIDRTAATRNPFDAKYSKVEDADWETSPLVLDPLSVKEQMSSGW